MALSFVQIGEETAMASYVEENSMSWEPENRTLPRKWVPAAAAVLGSLVIASAVYAGFCCRFSLDDFDPQTLYANRFVQPISHLQNLRYGGFSWQETDAWIAFQTDVEPALRMADAYRHLDSDEPSRWFMQALQKARLLSPLDRASLSDKENLCIFYRQKGPDSGEWFLYNQRTGLSYFRMWNRS